MTGAGAKTSRVVLTAVALAALVLLGLVGACSGDPVHDDLVTRLGPESSSVPPGPTHRPEQPCLACHGGSGPASTQFSIGGTAFIDTPGGKVPANGSVVTLIDANAVTATASANEVGNFWIPQSQWAPTFPVHVVGVGYGSTTYAMVTHIGRDGSCASCHVDPAGGAAVGHIYSPPADGGP
jgi:hypothetical protein